MGYTGFPNGASSFGMPLFGGGSLVPATTGSYFFVSSGTGSNGNYGLKDTPFATVDYAVGYCTASAGDVIVVMPSHAETIASATGLVADVAGVTIVGLGSGALRPTLTLATSTAATISVTAANVTFKNLIITAGIDELVTAFTVSGTNCTLDAVDYRESSSSYNCISFLTTTAAADFLTIINCHHTQTTAPAGAALWIVLVGADDFKIFNNNMYVALANSASSGVIGGTTTASLRGFLGYNNLINTGASGIAINMYTGTTGIAVYNNVGTAKTSQTGSIALASMYGAVNLTTNAANTNGLLDPGADT
jgi:hypothetical protein